MRLEIGPTEAPDRADPMSRFVSQDQRDMEPAVHRRRDLQEPHILIRGEARALRVLFPGPVAGLDTLPKRVSGEEDRSLVVTGLRGPVEHGPKKVEVVLDLAVSSLGEGLSVLQCM